MFLNKGGEMKTVLLVFCGILFAGFVSADTVLIRKSDGFPIEYQSNDVTKETLLNNNPAYTEDEVEVKTVSSQQYRDIAYEKIEKPLKDKKKKETDEKRTKIKQKLNLSDKELDDLLEILRDM
jgi:NAD(P)H-dependent flavin oxidoreductase YrpB (nitropropane dioxygenase family)